MPRSQEHHRRRLRGSGAQRPATGVGMAQWVPPPLVTGPTRFRVCPELVGRAVPPPLPAAPLPLRKRSTRHPLRLCSAGRGRWMRGPWGRRQRRPPSSARSPRTGARWPTSFCGVTLENTHGGPWLRCRLLLSSEEISQTQALAVLTRLQALRFQQPDKQASGSRRKSRSRR